MPSANAPKRLPSSGSGRSGSATNPTRQLRCCCAKAPDRAQTVASAIAEISVRRSIIQGHHRADAYHQLGIYIGQVLKGGLRGLEVDDELESGRLQYWQIARWGAYV